VLSPERPFDVWLSMTCIKFLGLIV